MSKSGEFVRDTTYLDGRITADGRDGWPAEPDRYRLVVARGCPWANRTIIVRRLLGLEPVLSMGICGPEHDERSWTFDLDPQEKDPVLGVHFLREAYEKAVPGYAKGVTVPAIVDIPTGAVVTSHFSHITLDLESQWTRYHRPGAPDLYPRQLADEIEEISAMVYADLNNGVYRCGFATDQAAYEKAYDKLFARLDWLEDRLRDRRYLAGDTITEADIRLWPTLARFDAVYHGHFKCNRNKLTEMPVLWAYARDLWQTPGFGDTIDFAQTKQHYYRVHTEINPTRIVPEGPDPSGWLTLHYREQLGGRPFGDGTAPGPPPEAERVPALVLPAAAAAAVWCLTGSAGATRCRGPSGGRPAAVSAERRATGCGHPRRGRQDPRPRRRARSREPARAGPRAGGGPRDALGGAAAGRARLPSRAGSP